MLLYIALYLYRILSEIIFLQFICWLAIFSIEDVRNINVQVTVISAIRRALDTASQFLSSADSQLIL